MDLVFCLEDGGMVDGPPAVIRQLPSFPFHEHNECGRARGGNREIPKGAEFS